MALGRNIVANYLGQAIRALLGIVLVPFYIQMLGIESYGLIGIFGVLQAWLVLLDFGLRPALSREMARFRGGAHTSQWIRDLLRSIEVLAGLVGATVAIGVSAASTWLAEEWVASSVLPASTIGRAFTVMGVVTALRFVENVYTSSLVGLQLQVRENAVSTAATVVRGLGAIAVLKWVSPTIEAFFAWQAVVSVASVLVLAPMVYAALPSGTRRAGFSRAAVREVWSFASGILVLTLQSLLLTNLDKLVLSRLLPLKEFGLYTLAGVAANTLGMMSHPVASALTPRFTELATRGDQAELERTYHLGAQAVGVLGGTTAVLLMTFSHRIILLWTRDPGVAGAVSTIASILVLGSLFNGLMYVPYQLQLAHGWTRLTTAFNVVLILLVTPSLLVLVPRYGGTGAAALWALLNGSYILFAVPLMHRRLLPSAMRGWYIDDTLKPLLSAVIVAQFWRLVLPPPTSRALEFFALATVSGTTLTAAALMTPLGRAVSARLLRARPP